MLTKSIFIIFYHNDIDPISGYSSSTPRRIKQRLEQRRERFPRKTELTLIQPLLMMIISQLLFISNAFEFKEWILYMKLNLMSGTYIHRLSYGNSQ